jgi:hypothetical protein
MKFIIALLSSLFFATTALAQQVFFSAPNIRNNWIVHGVTGDSTLNPACKMETRWSDGSFFTLIKDLKDGELYILIQVMAWNIVDPPGILATARMNFQVGGSVTGAAATFELLNKNTVRFRGISGERFLPDFDSATSLTIIMPNNIPNVFVNLTGSSAGLEAMSNCMRAYKSAPQTKPGINL